MLLGHICLLWSIYHLFCKCIWEGKHNRIWEFKKIKMKEIRYFSVIYRSKVFILQLLKVASQIFQSIKICYCIYHLKSRKKILQCNIRKQHSSQYVLGDLTSKDTLSEFRFYIWILKYMHYIGIHIHYFSKTHKYMLTSFWACSLISRVVKCPPTSFLHFPPSASALRPLTIFYPLFPNLENLRCVLGHSEKLLKQYTWNSEDDVLAPTGYKR